MMNDERGVGYAAHAAGADALALGVLASLGRWIERHPWWGVGRTLLLGVVTLGIGPVLIWVMRFHRMASSEAQQFWHLSEWIRLNRGTQCNLGELAARCRLRRSFTLFAVVGAILGVGALVASVYSTMFLVLAVVLPLWAGAVSMAYSGHYLGMMEHEKDVRRFFLAFSEIALKEGVNVEEVRGERGSGAMMYLSVLWPVGMVACCLEHRRYSRLSGLARKAIREAFRKMVERDGVEVETPVTWKRRCGNVKCMEFLREGAGYCWRCGAACTNATAPLDPYALNLTLRGKE